METSLQIKLQLHETDLSKVYVVLHTEKALALTV